MAAPVNMSTAARRLDIPLRELGLVIRSGRLCPDRHGRIGWPSVQDLRAELAAERGRSHIRRMERAAVSGLLRA